MFVSFQLCFFSVFKWPSVTEISSVLPDREGRTLPLLGLLGQASWARTPELGTGGTNRTTDTVAGKAELCQQDTQGAGDPPLFTHPFGRNQNPVCRRPGWRGAQAATAVSLWGTALNTQAVSVPLGPDDRSCCRLPQGYSLSDWPSGSGLRGPLSRLSLNLYLGLCHSRELSSLPLQANCEVRHSLGSGFMGPEVSIPT